jgi:hypothetical protein
MVAAEDDSGGNMDHSPEESFIRAHDREPLFIESCGKHHK